MRDWSRVYSQIGETESALVTKITSLPRALSASATTPPM